MHSGTRRLKAAAASSRASNMQKSSDTAFTDMQEACANWLEELVQLAHKVQHPFVSDALFVVPESRLKMTRASHGITPCRVAQYHHAQGKEKLLVLDEGSHSADLDMLAGQDWDGDKEAESRIVRLHVGALVEPAIRKAHQQIGHCRPAQCKHLSINVSSTPRA